MSTLSTPASTTRRSPIAGHWHTTYRGQHYTLTSTGRLAPSNGDTNSMYTVYSSTTKQKEPHMAFTAKPGPVTVEPSRWRTTAGKDEFTPAVYIKTKGRAGITVLVSDLEDLAQKLVTAAERATGKSWE